MAQPTQYLRQYNFSNYQASSPTSPLPAVGVEAEFNAIKLTMDQTLANLKLIQRDDGALANGVVTSDSLNASLQGLAILPPTSWLTGTTYAVNQTVVVNGVTLYRCLVAHTAGVFATDLAAAKWLLIYDLSTTFAAVGTFTSGSFTGDGVTTAFNLGATIGVAERVIWVENGLTIAPVAGASGYTVAGSTVTRGTAPGVGVAVRWRLLGSVSITTIASVPSGSVGASQIVDRSITAAKIAVDAITATEIAPNAITSSELADGAVDTAAIQGFAVTEAKEVLEDWVNIASATFAADLPATTTRYQTITGTSTIASGGTMAAGYIRIFKAAASGGQLTHSGSFSLIGSANITLTAGDKFAMKSLGAGNWEMLWFAPISGGGSTPRLVTVYTSGSGTHTTQSWTKRIRVRGVGGGGAGGGNPNTGASEGCAGSGGGAGGYFEHEYTSVSATYSYGVGAGGTGVSSANGNAGGNTTFGALTANAGAGGAVGTSAGTFATRGAAAAGGSASGANIANSTGGSGYCVLTGVGGAVSGFGGGSVLGPGGAAVVNLTGGTVVNGNNGSTPGGGGSGSAALNKTASGTGTGGNGGAGLIIVEEFAS